MPSWSSRSLTCFSRGWEAREGAPGQRICRADHQGPRRVHRIAPQPLLSGVNVLASSQRCRRTWGKTAYWLVLPQIPIYCATYLCELLITLGAHLSSGEVWNVATSECVATLQGASNANALVTEGCSRRRRPLCIPGEIRRPQDCKVMNFYRKLLNFFFSAPGATEPKFQALATEKCKAKS